MISWDVIFFFKHIVSVAGDGYICQEHLFRTFCTYFICLNGANIFEATEMSSSSMCRQMTQSHFLILILCSVWFSG